MRRRDLLIASLSSLPLSATRARASSGPVVLELFTSQGCLSCPPADALLGELVREPGVIGLAWHVDYWNSLGWHDRFARREWTDRQKSYAKYLDGEVFTPALAVNGAAMLFGSDQTAVRRALVQASPLPVSVVLRRSGSGLEAEIGPTSAPVTGLLVTYDPRQATKVDAGENQGSQLVEYRVVRDVVTLDRLAPRLTLPPVPATRGTVLLVQDASWQVTGAADLAPDQGS
jgi:hypothetical protein